MKKKRYVLYIVTSVFFLLSLGALLVGAYLVDGDRARNALVIGGNETPVIETFPPPEEITPGAEYIKEVKAENTGPTPCYVRIKAVFTDGDMGENCLVDWNQKDWIFDRKDGYFYYPKVLSQGESTPDLFTKVKIGKELTKEEIKKFDMIVYSESYQAKGFSDYREAWADYRKNRPKL